MSTSTCRACKSPLQHVFCDLGLSPISNAFIKPENQKEGEIFYPLRVYTCDQCWLVQLDNSPQSEAHFHDDYVYFSSFSDGWLKHARRYVEAMIARFHLNADSKIIEIASNDGYLLQYFVKAGVPCLGIEPTSNTAAAARSKGVDTRECFFGEETATRLAAEGHKVDLLLGNNVLAHVPDINDFVSGMPIILKPDGVITLEFPHLVQLMMENQFDTIYHEHYSYLSLLALLPIFSRSKLRVFDVEKLPTHGGSLRVYLCHDGAKYITSQRVDALLKYEADLKLAELNTYQAFANRVLSVKYKLLDFMLQAKQQGKSIAAYGAAAKGNTLLNYCGIGTDFIDYVADKNPTKQNRLLPGTRIPVVSPEMINKTKPDYLLILPWNIKEEVVEQMKVIRDWGGQFVIPIPSVEVLS